MPTLTLLVGPPGSGKSTKAHQYLATEGDRIERTVYVNQDSQKDKHLDIFLDALDKGQDIIVDRMNFNKQQRERYLGPAKLKGYTTRIDVLHEAYDTCLGRIRERFGKHETVNDEKSARGALQTFFGKYERPQEGEADQINFIYPSGNKPKAVICDLDGTLADCEHRRHFVRRPQGEKKDWRSFFLNMDKDPVIEPVYEILYRFQSESPEDMNIVFCSGRPDDYAKLTKEWLEKTGLKYSSLLMRSRHDTRQDDIIKEILLDFEILTRYTPMFILDDRQQVVDMWRKRGYICLQVAPGDF